MKQFKFPILSIVGLLTAMLLASSMADAQTPLEDRYRAQTYSSGTVLDVPEAETAPAPQVLPRQSLSKAAVRRQYGEPERVFAPVGEPPITRWDYPGFRVFFEYDLVLHSVVPGRFPSISHRDQLSPGR